MSWDTSSRTLAWMVYLNDVEDGGETEWLYQELKIKPQKGRVVIWYRGHLLIFIVEIHQRTDKYIATGWYASCDGIDKRYVSR